MGRMRNQSRQCPFVRTNGKLFRKTRCECARSTGQRASIETRVQEKRKYVPPGGRARTITVLYQSCITSVVTKSGGLCSSTVVSNRKLILPVLRGGWTGAWKEWRVCCLNFVKAFKTTFPEDKALPLLIHVFDSFAHTTAIFLNVGLLVLVKKATTLRYHDYGDG